MSICTSNPISSFLHSRELHHPPAEVLTHAKRCLTDLLATLASGSETELSSIIKTFASASFGAGGEHVAFSLNGNVRLSPAGAALVDAMTIDSMDAHDGHALTKGHVGCAVVAALASSVQQGGWTPDGREFLTLLAAGYEIGTRAGIALHATADDYHSSGAWNAITCAALVGHTLGLSEVQFTEALGIAEYHGPRSQLMRDVDFPTMVKDGSGWGAMAGVSAAHLAKLGFTGAPALLVMADNVQKYWSDLGHNWRIFEQYFKPYPVCRWAHPAIDAALALKKSHQLKPSDIKQVRVQTFHTATRLSQVPPQTTDQAQYATCYPLAVALCHDGVHPRQIMESQLTNPQVLEVFNKIVVAEEPEFTKRFPAERLATLEVLCHDGTILTSGPQVAKGDPKNPLSDSDLTDKYFDLTTPVWGEERARKIYDLVQGLDQEGASALDLLCQVRSAHELA
ncbi:MmgE/PrpD family protein [Alcaligenes nematophilus]|uniref:MmgE/PrpD family protein n=1 Tax=Alcaligenes nematophilus TaxID=2994643 RepID=UPI002462A1DC|nr:MmgE/PrpD family protein [Alcaligenes nematophilus]MDH4865417.1 MmgE/PrpD family protein [Bacillus cereus]MDY7126716.1 MmgE/PrpD family protein [Alcaligenes nematophilus]